MMEQIARAARVVGSVLTVGVFVWSTSYFVVYLGRWEWNRAIVSGLVALGLLTVLCAAVVLRRLTTLDRRLDHALVQGRAQRVAADAAGGSACELIDDANVAAARVRFEWLRPDGRSTAVFIPVLLGTGMILSLLAYAVERVAGVFANATLDRRTASIIPLDLPMSGRTAVRGIGPAAHLPARPAADPPATRVTSRRTRALVAALAVLVAAGGLEGLRRLTQSDGGLHAPGSTTVVVEVDTKRATAVEAAVTSMWAMCRPRIGDPELRSLVGDGSRVTLVIDRALLVTGQRRLLGCFEDYSLDYAVLDVIEVVTQHAPPA